MIDRMELEHRIELEAYGVPLRVGTSSAELLPRIENLLPPRWRRIETDDEDVQHFSLVTADGISYRVDYGDGSVAGSSDLAVALDVLDSHIRAHIALHAPKHIFVHAGVVAHNERTIVIPGPSFSGKTTLVAELVRAGATYYSDEYAVLDESGLVHPYAKPLSLRLDGLAQTDHDVEALGGRAGDEALPIGLVAVTQYRPGARWAPRRLSPGEGVLALMTNTVPAQDRPAEAMNAVRRAVEGVLVLEGDRGEASEVVDDLLARDPA
jgi:hypothetical protein